MVSEFGKIRSSDFVKVTVNMTGHKNKQKQHSLSYSFSKQAV